MTAVQNETVRLVDKDDKEVIKVQMPPRQKGEGPRFTRWMGRKFVEQDGGGFYPRGTFVEVDE